MTAKTARLARVRDALVAVRLEDVGACSFRELFLAHPLANPLRPDP